ncbi:MAG: hypothetical protein KatS3mg121_0475 [Gammaproteobacteria bacterium]|nr:MAG: hypothetical protein KatS3mg121_0475 [Gammaproteobacteria bacterium]
MRAPRRPQARHGRPLAQIRAAHLVTEIEQHLGDAAHAHRRRCRRNAPGAPGPSPGARADRFRHRAVSRPSHHHRDRHFVRHPLGGIRLRQSPCRLGHAQQAARGPPAVHTSASPQALGVERRADGTPARHRPRRNGGRCGTGGRPPHGRVRHQHGAQAGGRQLRQRQGTGAGDGEIGPGVGLGHVFDEGRHAGRQPRLRGNGLRPPPRSATPHWCQHLGTPTPPAARPAPPAPRLVEKARAAAAAQHQHAGRPPPAGEALGRRRAGRRSRGAPGCRSCAPPRNAPPGKPCNTTSASGASRRLVSPGTAFCSCTIQRPAQQPCRQPARTRGEAAHAEHRPRPQTQHGERGLEQRPTEPQRRRSARRRAHGRAGRSRAGPANGIPAPAATRASRPPRAPIQATGTPRRRSASATASAGNTWPPVPPAMIRTGPPPRAISAPPASAAAAASRPARPARRAGFPGPRAGSGRARRSTPPGCCRRR